MKTLYFDIFTDYFQFYIQDESVDGINGKSWTPDACKRSLAVEKGTVGIGTVRNMDAGVAVEIHKAMPEQNYIAWDYVVECGLEVPSGYLVIAGCTDYFPDAKRIKLPKGQYRVRVYYGAQNDISEDGFDGNDHYLIKIWPSTDASIIIIKQRSA